MISYRHADLAAVREALLEVGVPAVIAGGGSVFATPAAVEWLTLLEALEQPHRSARVRSAALTCFLGHTADELDSRGDDLTDEVADTLRAWVELFSHPRRRRGARGRQRRRAARTGAGRGRGRPPADRPAPHRRGPPRGHAHRSPRPGLAADLAARAGLGGSRRPRRRAHPPARLRRRRGAAGDDPREQGPRVPRRLPARRRRPARPEADPTPLPRRRRATGASTSAAGAPTGPTTAGAGRTRRPASGCGCSTSRSPAPSHRSCAGGRPPRTPSPRRCTGC